jgi:hypothetical protein
LCKKEKLLDLQHKLKDQEFADLKLKNDEALLYGNATQIESAKTFITDYFADFRSEDREV